MKSYLVVCNVYDLFIIGAVCNFHGCLLFEQYSILSSLEILWLLVQCANFYGYLLFEQYAMVRSLELLWVFDTDYSVTIYIKNELL